nr:outer envelope protein 80, chloroplastic [Tanacetum cinerariifolium]
MPESKSFQFRSSSVKIPHFTTFHHRHNHRKPPLFADLNLHISSLITNTKHSLTHFISKHSFPKLTKPSYSPLLCSASLSVSNNDELTQSTEVTQSRVSRHDDERVLISEVLVRNKDGEELERKDLVEEAVKALKTCRPNSALTVREVQEDVHRIIGSGYFSSCLPVAVDTRDGIRLVFQMELRVFILL